MSDIEKNTSAFKNLPPSQRRENAIAAEEKDPLSIRFVRKFLLQLLACLFIVGGTIFSFQVKTPWAKKTQEYVKHALHDQINIQELQQTGQRIAGYFHEKLYEKN